MTPEMSTPTTDKTKVADSDSAEHTAPTAAAATAAADGAGEEAVTKISGNSSSPKETEAGSVTGTGVRGEFGISADWVYALSMPDAGGGDASLRGDACLGEKEQQGVQEILRRREATPAGSKVGGPVAG